MRNPLIRLLSRGKKKAVFVLTFEIEDMFNANRMASNWKSVMQCRFLIMCLVSQVVVISCTHKLTTVVRLDVFNLIISSSSMSERKYLKVDWAEFKNKK